MPGQTEWLAYVTERIRAFDRELARTTDPSTRHLIAERREAARAERERVFAAIRKDAEESDREAREILDAFKKRK